MGNRVDYTCPGCGREVWALSMWAGNVCWECPGTILHGVVKGTPLRIAETVVTTIGNVKTEYKCPRCKKDVWAYGQFAGQTCWDCKAQNPIDYLDILGQVGTSIALTPSIGSVGRTGLIGAASAHTAVRRIGGTALEAFKVNHNVQDSIGEIEHKDIVKSVEIRSCWISDNAVTAPASMLTFYIQGKLVRHWWVVIETIKGNWYWAELNIGAVSLLKCNSYDQVNNQGKRSGNCQDDLSQREKQYTFKSPSRSMESVEKWVRNSNHRYDLQYHNCQDWAKEFYDWV